jgi:hypothetical protein
MNDVDFEFEQDDIDGYGGGEAFGSHSNQFGYIHYEIVY